MAALKEVFNWILAPEPVSPMPPPLTNTSPRAVTMALSPTPHPPTKHMPIFLFYRLPAVPATGTPGGASKTGLSRVRSHW